jgi:hypothetical protein
MTMPNIDRIYLALALALLVVGELVGLYMGIAENNSLLPLHTTLMLIGFVTLAIYGFVFRLWPALKEGALARVQFWLTIVSTLGMVIGSYQFAVSRSIVIAAPASMLTIVAAVLLAFMFWTHSEKA